MKYDERGNDQGMISENTLRMMLHTRLDSNAPPDGFESRVLAAMPRNRVARRRAWIVALLVPLLIASIAVASAILWPDLINRILPKNDVSDKTQGMLSVMEAYGGHEVFAEEVSAGVRLRTHFMVCDGSDVSVFFSFENESGDPKRFAELETMTNVLAEGPDQSHSVMTVDVRLDDATGLLYGMASGTLLDGSNSPITVAQGDPLRLKLHYLEPMPPEVKVLSSVTSEGLTAPLLGTNLAEPYPYGTLVLHEVTLENGTLDVRYTITPVGEDDLHDPRHRMYLAVLRHGDEANVSRLMDSWPVVRGEGHLTAKDISEGATLALVTHEANAFRGSEPSFDVEVPIRIAETVPVREMPLDILLDRDGIPLRLIRAELRPTSLTVLAEIREAELPEALLPKSGTWSRHDGGVGAIREAVFGLGVDLQSLDGESAGLARTDVQIMYPALMDMYGAEDAAAGNGIIEVFQKYTGLMPTELNDARLIFMDRAGEELAGVEAGA